MSSAASKIDLEIIMLNEVSRTTERQIWYQLYVESLKNDTNELIYKIKTDSQTSKKSYGCQGGNVWGKGARIKLRVWD